MKTKLSAPVTTQVTYSEASAHALLSYAETNPLFKAWFANLIGTHCAQETLRDPLPYQPILSPLTIQHEDLAVRRALWLLDSLSHTRLPSHEQTLQTLHSWAYGQEKDETQFIILGLKYGVLNYGIIGYPKRRNEPLNILMRTDMIQATNIKTLAQVTTKLSGAILEQGLIKAGGTTTHLEPELSDWLFGDKQVAFFTGDRATLAEIALSIEHANIPSSYQKDMSGITYLAITPALYLPEISGYEKLTVLEG